MGKKVIIGDIVHTQHASWTPRPDPGPGRTVRCWPACETGKDPVRDGYYTDKDVDCVGCVGCVGTR